jgi:hypothetical protein
MGNNNWMKITVGNCDGKKSLSKNKHRWKYIIKMGIKGMVLVDVI